MAEHAFALASAAYFGKKIYEKGVRATLEGALVSVVKSVPGGADFIKGEQAKVVEKIEQFVLNHDDPNKVYEMPAKGIDRDELYAMMSEWRDKEKEYRSGKAFGGIYTDDHEHEKFVHKVYSLYADSNALYPGVFPGLRKFEAEVVQMALSIMSGSGVDSTCCGTMTSGGTESILMAIKGYRSYARKTRGQPSGGAHKRFNIVVPQSAHAAFPKAAYYLDLEFRMVPVNDSTNYRVDVKALESMIDENTIAIVGSAPAFPQGVIDPIPALAQVAKRHQIGLHVDACLGGFVLPFLEEIGVLPNEKCQWDFRVDGVTSISADIHKYGFGPKGCSVVLWANNELRKCQFYKYTEWSGGIYATSTMAGSRPGGAIAGAWATLMTLGHSGYKAHAERIHAAHSAIVQGAASIEGIRVLGPPDACTVAMISDQVDIFKVADALMRENWQVNRLQKPICIQLQIGDRSNFHPEEFLQCLSAAVKAVRANPGDFNDGLAAVYSDAANMGDRNMVGDLMEEYLAALYKV
eukprot:CAMPEP_0201548228 /NCGR_PEP_ID=MMETSP0173_2-20130828/4759_1 /ASSEMBLY_ACC=CAM_ASM_000268 /TAXON_ID=218659 /ORGANISM="Vexillifera sp., Strain DIVA3 564/2" /LENGTH=520 /DNA_ID=CAMNT_0047957541 /DNA_START=108 /DNA_END=1670 /DNA_ORIENTATION=-